MDFIVAHSLEILIAMLLLTVGIWISLPLIFKDYCKAAKFNNQLVAKILNTTIKKELFFASIKISGYYKGRCIVWEPGHPENFISALVQDTGPHRIYIKPNFVPKTKLLPPYPGPTNNTLLAGKHIYYKLRLKSFLKLFSEQEIIAIFEELTQAAELIEKPQWSNKTTK